MKAVRAGGMFEKCRPCVVTQMVKVFFPRNCFKIQPSTSITLWSKQINNLRGTTNPIQFFKFNNIAVLSCLLPRCIFFALILENKIM